MRNIRCSTIYAALCLYAVPGCRYGVQPLPPPPMHPRINPPAIAFIEVSPDAKSAAIMVGEVMRISVGENTTTGYHWKVVAIGSKILKQLPFVVQPEVSTTSSNPLAGNGSVTTFQFQGVAPGTTDLMLNYAPFYSPKPKNIAEKIRIKVTVTASHV